MTQADLEVLQPPSWPRDQKPRGVSREDWEDWFAPPLNHVSVSADYPREWRLVFHDSPGKALRAARMRLTPADCYAFIANGVTTVRAMARYRLFGFSADEIAVLTAHAIRLPTDPPRRPRNNVWRLPLITRATLVTVQSIEPGKLSQTLRQHVEHLIADLGHPYDQPLPMRSVPVLRCLNSIARQYESCPEWACALKQLRDELIRGFRRPFSPAYASACGFVLPSRTTHAKVAGLVNYVRELNEPSPQWDSYWEHEAILEAIETFLDSGVPVPWFLASRS